MAAQARAEGRVDLPAAETVRCDEDCMPAPRPAECGGSTLYVRRAFRGSGIIGGGDGPLLGAEGLRGVAAHRLEVLRFGAACSRHRIAKRGEDTVGRAD